jgi:glycosyltransferase involved in cell wall biosynthesis
MKILVVSPRPPSPANKADAMTVDRMIRFLANQGHRVDLICFAENENESQAVKDGLQSVCGNIDTIILPIWKSFLITALGLLRSLPLQVNYYRSRHLKLLVERKVANKHYDIVYTHLIRMAEYTRGLSVPKVLGLQVSQALNLGRMIKYTSNPFLKLFYQIELRKVKSYEATVAQDFDRVLLCGQSDIDALTQTVPVQNASVCPHGQDIPDLSELQNVEKHQNVIAMSGVMSTHTNLEAVLWFATEIFPRVLRKCPDSEFWIIGRNPNQRIRNLRRNSQIRITGEVTNLYEWLTKASVAVAPVRIAAGMQNKIVQAMACRLPVVSTTAANEGIAAKPDEHIIVKDDPQEFSEAIIELLGNRVKRTQIGDAARKFVEQQWSWGYHFRRQEKIFLEVIEKHKGNRIISTEENRTKSEKKL